MSLAESVKGLIKETESIDDSMNYIEDVMTEVGEGVTREEVIAEIKRQWGEK